MRPDVYIRSVTTEEESSFLKKRSKRLLIASAGSPERSGSMPEFEWDDNKRRYNFEKHGFDFVDGDVVFSHPHVVAPANAVKGESRQLCTGMLNDVWVTIVFTMRKDVVRIISMRRARNVEKARYKKILCG